MIGERLTRMRGDLLAVLVTLDRESHVNSKPRYGEETAARGLHAVVVSFLAVVCVAVIMRHAFGMDMLLHSVAVARQLAFRQAMNQIARMDGGNGHVRGKHTKRIEDDEERRHPFTR